MGVNRIVLQICYISSSTAGGPKTGGRLPVSRKEISMIGQPKGKVVWVVRHLPKDDKGYDFRLPIGVMDDICPSLTWFQIRAIDEEQVVLGKAHGRSNGIRCKVLQSP
jgi:hypothetical protein